jgi:hypothetical protein
MREGIRAGRFPHPFPHLPALLALLALQEAWPCKEGGECAYPNAMRPLQHGLAAALLLLSMSMPVWAGPFEEAIAAYNQHDYRSALQLLRPLAESGNVRAQALLGFMYEGGMGVLGDDIEAAKWYRGIPDRCLVRLESSRDQSTT